jgi:hypothetical protein
MTVVEHSSASDLQGADALFPEARRRRRRRRIAGVIALVALSTGSYAFVSGIGKGGGVNTSGHVPGSSLLGVLPNNRSYRDCPGSAHVGPATFPDGLPAKVSRTDDLAFVTFVAKGMASGPYLGLTHPFVGLPDRKEVKAIRVGPGGGYVWTRDTAGQVAVVHIKNYGIYVYLRSSSECPNGGLARLADGGVQVTFLAPRA